MPRKRNWEVGNVVEVALADGSFAYGVVLTGVLIAFARQTHEVRPEITPALFDPVSFRVWVMKYAIGKNGWPMVGRIEVTPAIASPPTFYRYDMISKKFYHYVDCVNDIPVERKDCIGLECAAVWDPPHVADRLLDEKMGKPSKWVESMKAENQ